MNTEKVLNVKLLCNCPSLVVIFELSLQHQRWNQIAGLNPAGSTSVRRKSHELLSLDGLPGMDSACALKKK